MIYCRLQPMILPPSLFLTLSLIFFFSSRMLIFFHRNEYVNTGNIQTMKMSEFYDKCHHYYAGICAGRCVGNLGEQFDWIDSWMADLKKNITTSLKIGICWGMICEPPNQNVSPLHCVSEVQLYALQITSNFKLPAVMHVGCNSGKCQQHLKKHDKPNPFKHPSIQQIYNLYPTENNISVLPNAFVFSTCLLISMTERHTSYGDLPLQPFRWHVSFSVTQGFSDKQLSYKGMTRNVTEKLINLCKQKPQKLPKRYKDATVIGLQQETWFKEEGEKRIAHIDCSHEKMRDS